jgi:hypothetical protein
MPVRYDQDTKAKAIRLVREHAGDYPSEYAAITAVAWRLGMTPETLRKWIRQAAVALAYPDRPVGNDPFAGRDEFQPGQVTDLHGGQFGVVAEVEVLQGGVGDGEPGRADPPGDLGGVAAGHLEPAQGRPGRARSGGPALVLGALPADRQAAGCAGPSNHTPLASGVLVIEQRGGLAGFPDDHEQSKVQPRLAQADWAVPPSGSLPRPPYPRGSFSRGGVRLDDLRRLVIMASSIGSAAASERPAIHHRPSRRNPTRPVNAFAGILRRPPGTRLVPRGPRRNT